MTRTRFTGVDADVFSCFFVLGAGIESLFGSVASIFRARLMRSKSRKAKMNALPPGPISGAILIWNAKDARIRKDIQGTLEHARLASAIASEPKYARRGGLSAEKRMKRARPHVITWPGTTGCPERFSTALTRK